MARKKKGDKIDGWIVLDKPAGMSSTQALGKVRWLLKAQKAGHGGTLDPLATGILPIALGEATKTISFCQNQLKVYTFDIIWGEMRDTDDAEGKVIATSDIRPATSAIHALLPQFMGEIEQVPPKFSAIKIDGERAYDLARAGEEVELASRIVYIETLELTASTDTHASLRCLCGKGTYIRSLARDMAHELGTFGYVANLRRESVGPFTLDNAVTLEQLEAGIDDALLPLETSLDGILTIALQEREAARLRNGQSLQFIARPDVDRLFLSGFDLDIETMGLATCNGTPVALVEVKGVEIHPVRVLNL